MKQNASSNPLVAIIGCACTATRQGQAGKRKITACYLALDPRYSQASRTELRLYAVVLVQAKLPRA